MEADQREPYLFAIFIGEYRRYFPKEHNWGWYLGANMA